MREHDESPEDIVQPIGPVAGGGQVIIPRTDLVADLGPHVKGEAPGSEEDSESFEDDADLLSSGRSPEFEHLRKPPRLPGKPEAES